MKINRIILVSTWLFLWIRCGTRLKVDIQQEIGIPRPAHAYVAIVEQTGASLPPENRIGIISVGPAKDWCDYLSLISAAKQTARQMGGNLLWITKKEQDKKGCLALEAQVLQVQELSPWTGKIIWDQQRPLRSSDFRSAPPLSLQANALTYSGFFIELERDLESDRPRLLSYTFFDPAKSWMQPKDRSNVDLLAHEQLHFDLSEWVRRDLERALNRLSPAQADFMDQVNATFDEYLLRLDSLQKAYDRETRHGLITDQQATWAQKIKKGLQH